MTEVAGEFCRSAAEQGWLAAGEPPLALMGHSFGTFLAVECARALQAAHGYAAQHVVSVAGIAREFLQQLPLYQEDFDVRDEALLRRKTEASAAQMYTSSAGELEQPAELDADMRRHGVEGQ